MISDVVSEDGSLEYMIDMIVGRKGELLTRGPVTGASFSLGTPAGHHTTGFADCAFHPNFGTAFIRGVNNNQFKHLNESQRFQLLASPLQASSVIGTTAPVLSFGYATKGTNGDEVRLDHDVQVLPFEQCHQHAILPNEVVFAGLLGNLFKWGGSALPDYTVGTVSTTAGSRIVTGAGGTAWATQVEEGMYIFIDAVGEKGSNGEQRAFRITYVQDNDTLEVDYPMAASVAGRAYRIAGMAVVQSPPGTWNPDTDRPATAGIVAYHQGRLFVAGTADADTDYSTVFNLDRVRWSANAVDANEGGPETGFHHIDIWRPPAYIDVAPGVGGAIRGLVSMGDELVVIKSHALFRITGSPAVSGGSTNLNVQVQLIADGVGASGLKAWAMTKRGLVIASQDGLYLYDGMAVKSLTDGRLSRWWRNNYRFYTFTVTAYNDKVIVSTWLPEALGGGATTSLLWDIEKDYFGVISGHLVSCGAMLYTADDEFVGDLIFPQYLGGGCGYWYATKMLVGMIDNDADAVSWGLGTNAPSGTIVTHPIPVADGPLSEGRVNLIAVNSYLEGVHSDPMIEAGIYYGQRLTSYLAPYQAQSGDLEYGINAPDAGVTNNINRVTRINVDECRLASSHRVYLNATARVVFHLYAIGVDYSQADVIGPTT